jgi:hypothetical protein
MSHLTIDGQIPGQLELPDEIVRQFRLPGRWEKRQGWQLEPGHTVVVTAAYQATGRRAPKAPKVHWHDWMREQTKPWRPPADGPMRTKPGPDTYTVETVPNPIGA